MQNEGRVERFNLGERMAHWNHAISFCLLFVTGAALIFRSWGGLLGPHGVKLAQDLHHVMAVPFTFFTLLILLVGTRKTFFAWLKEIFTWGNEDMKFLGRFPREFFGLKVELPEQGKFNAGEKVNSILTIAGSAVMAVTGWILLFRAHFSREVLAWAYPIHDAGALVMGAVIIGHVYLSLLHPRSREAINGMLWGTVTAKFAREHHARWYRQVRQNQATPRPGRKLTSMPAD
ncbi:MAG: cytochrome b/b6 domain-containing protein [Firmicutes bacterium]|nr:cytochrome b/b6 domain-containing protein [Bacillota bacterium]